MILMSISREVELCSVFWWGRSLMELKCGRRGKVDGEGTTKIGDLLE
jgi:hypothetical protein